RLLAVHQIRDADLEHVICPDAISAAGRLAPLGGEREQEGAIPGVGQLRGRGRGRWAHPAACEEEEGEGEPRKPPNGSPSPTPLLVPHHTPAAEIRPESASGVPRRRRERTDLSPHENMEPATASPLHPPCSVRVEGKPVGRPLIFKRYRFDAASRLRSV